VSEELPVLDWGHEVKERDLQWLWPGRIPLGKITLLAGDPEAGKSFVVCDLAARTTRGGPWPDGVEPVGPEVSSEPGSDATGSVLFITAEDNVEDTLLPRLRAAGANIRKCSFLRGVAKAGEATKPFDFESQWHNFELAIARTFDCKLVVIDPM